MAQKLFNVVVYYQDVIDLEVIDAPTVTIVAKDDIMARAKAIELNERRIKREQKAAIRRVLYCDVNYNGTIDAHASTVKLRKK